MKLIPNLMDQFYFCHVCILYSFFVVVQFSLIKTVVLKQSQNQNHLGWFMGFQCPTQPTNPIYPTNFVVIRIWWGDSGLLGLQVKLTVTISYYHHHLVWTKRKEKYWYHTSSLCIHIYRSWCKQCGPWRGEEWHY